MAKFKFPGVYVEEKPRFQKMVKVPSVAVFIGYTEKHVNANNHDIVSIPTIITSLLEFEHFYGSAQSEQSIEILDRSLQLAKKLNVYFKDVRSHHNLYYSVRLFFAQGGKSCTILSVGNFKSLGDPLSASELLSGLEILRTETANLLICISESQNLESQDFFILQQALLKFCKEHSAFALLDLPKTTAQNLQNDIATYRTQLQSDSLSHGAAFFPNLLTVYSYFYDETTLIIKQRNRQFALSTIKDSEPALYSKYKNALEQFFVSLPPSPAAAGAFLRNDDLRGIWKVPANIALDDVLRPEIAISEIDQDFLYFDNVSGKSINPIRVFSGKGTLIWGSRTLAGNDAEGKFIPVRRFINQVEKDLQNSMQSLVFNENSPTVWANIQQQTENYLMSHFSNGAFPGRTIREAFFVHCGLGATMTQNDIDKGVVIIEIGLAPVRPAEFIMLRIHHEIGK